MNDKLHNYMINNILKIIFLFIFLSCANDNTTASDNISDQSLFGIQGNLNIITWNIENFPKEDELTIDYLVETINLMELDIIALQEIRNTDSFNQLVNKLGDSWVGYRAGNGNYQELSYLINTERINYEQPYTILDQEEYYFAYRAPYVLEFSYNNQNFILINVHYKCCGDGNLNLNDGSDEEFRRLTSSTYLENYITTNFDSDNVIILGDFNDELTDSYNNNIFNVFTDNPDKYRFTDIEMAEQSDPWQYWSFPNWPSHLDHILISNELFDDFNNSNSISNTILIDGELDNGWQEYDFYLSDHRPVGISLEINP